MKSTLERFRLYFFLALFSFITSKVNSNLVHMASMYFTLEVGSFIEMGQNTNSRTRDIHDFYKDELFNCLENPDFRESFEPEFCRRNLSPLICSRLMKCNNIYVGVYGEDYFPKLKKSKSRKIFNLMQPFDFDISDGFYTVLRLHSTLYSYSFLGGQRTFYLFVLDEE